MTEPTHTGEIDLFQEAQRIGRCGAFSWDLRTNEIEWSPEFFRILGRGPDDVEHSWDGFLSCVHPDDRDHVVAEAERIMAAGRHHDVFYRMVMPDGEVRHWVSKGRLEMAGGDPVRMFGFSQDITELVRARRTARRQAELLTHAQTLGRMGSWQVDLNTGKVTWSDECYRIHGIPVGTEITIDDAVELFDEAYRPRVAEAVAEAGRTGSQVEFEALLHAADGVDRWVRVLGRESAAESRVMQGIIQDISDRRELEEARMHRSRVETVGLLAGGIAHDFNNLLSVILGNAELLAAQGGQDVLPYVTEIEEAASRGRALTTSLLSFSRKRVIQPRIVAPGQVARDLSGMLARLVPARIALELSVETEGTVRMDPVQLEQVIMNLVTNARDAIPGEGHIGLGVREADGEVVLEVTDDGSGIPEEAREEIFQPFFSTKGDRGTGLGLATVATILEGAAGRIDVESTPGQGTTFRVRLPRVDRAVPESGPVDLAAEVPSVLLVDDDEGVRLLNEIALRNRGHEVAAFASAEEALAHVERHGPPDFLLTDVVMPGISGMELTRRLRDRAPGLPTLLVSGFVDGETLELLQVEEVPVLSKPFTPSQLAAAMEEVLAAGSAGPGLAGRGPAGAGSTDSPLSPA